MSVLLKNILNNNIGLNKNDFLKKTSVIKLTKLINRITF